MEQVKDHKHSQSQTVHWRIFIFSTVLALTGLLSAPQLDAGIYQWVDENGVKHYSNKSPVKDSNVKILFDEYQHDEIAHLIRVKTDQETIDALTEEIIKEEQQASVEEQKKLEEAKPNQSQWSASECFSPPYSVQEGRSAYERITPRLIGEGEYLDLQKLFQRLEGEWAGNARVLRCTTTEGELDEQISNYSIMSEGRMRTREQFVLESTLQSEENWTTEDEIFRLYLSEKSLAEESPNSDIELISVSSDELAYFRKVKPRHKAGKILENVTTIKKTGEASFALERIVYLNGRLRSKSSWQLERR
ncbi:MAG: DUF4124 domain-containing protein [Desulfobacterales bacterium]|nr:DUF4124 domain-containing protein [Desulfobacterales bacterium]